MGNKHPTLLTSLSVVDFDKEQDLSSSHSLMDESQGGVVVTTSKTRHLFGREQINKEIDPNRTTRGLGGMSFVRKPDPRAIRSTHITVVVKPTMMPIRNANIQQVYCNVEALRFWSKSMPPEVKVKAETLRCHHIGNAMARSATW